MLPLEEIIDRLALVYGEPPPAPSHALLEFVLIENVAYLVNDERRVLAFRALEKAVGTRPEQILAASDAVERILLLTRSHAVLGLDSNGVRMLTRLGFDWLIRAEHLLRQHGQELCRRSNPRCDRCPLSDTCAYFADF